MNRFTPFLSGIVLLSIASPLYAQKKPLPSGEALLQSAYSAYDKPKTIQVRLSLLAQDGTGKPNNTEMTMAVENDSGGKITRGLMTIKQVPNVTGEAVEATERHLLVIGEESFSVLPQEKKYAPRKREAKRFSDFFRLMIGAFLGEKTTYSVAEAKMGGKPVYQITTSVFNGTRARITLEKDSRLFRRMVVFSRETETLAEIKFGFPQRNAPIAEELFAKPGADYMLDPEILNEGKVTDSPPAPASEGTPK